MSIKKRKLFFYLLLTAFVIGGGAAVFYSQGYRFDYKTIAIQKVGAIFVKSEPADAIIFLDGKPIKNQSWFLQDGTLINNLTPGIYTLEVQKDGYRSWLKHVIVNPSLVSEADAVKLLTSNASTQVNSSIKDLKKFGEIITLQKSNGTLLINGKSLTATGTLAAISPDQKSGVFLNAKRNGFFMRDLESVSPTLNLSLLFNNLRGRILQSSGNVAIKYIDFLPGDSQKLFIGTSRAVYLMDKEKLTLALLQDTGVHYFKVTANGFFWLTDKGELRRYNYQNRERETVMTGAADLKDIEVLPNSPETSFAVLNASGSLTLFDPQLTRNQVIADKAILVAFSSDNQKIVFVDRDGKINVQYLLKPEKNISFTLPNGGVIDAVSWYRDSRHLFIRYTDGRIYFTETDGPAPLNSYLLGERIDAYAYDGNQDALLMLQGTNLLQFSLANK